MADFEAREGDVLVVSYPEIKLPIAQYASVTVGGVTYSRKLATGDDPQAEYDKIYDFLKRNAERDAATKVRLWSTEMRGAGKAPPPLDSGLRGVAPGMPVRERGSVK